MFEKVITLENPIEAQVIEEELTARAIPHSVVSFHDTAYDGIFQMTAGWGRLDAPKEFREEILEIIRDLKHNGEQNS